jgi:hypothetical protein
LLGEQTLGKGTTSERTLEVVVLGEPPQHDVDRALPVVRIVTAPTSATSISRAITS